MLITPEDILASCAVVTVLAGLFLWANKSMLAPFKVLISANTDAMQSLKELVTVHAEKIDDHGERIAKIEAKHSVRHGGE
jgi:uncharacterized sodium:solute symporter family permease YidK